MTATETSTMGAGAPAGVVRRLSMLDRFLPVWILAAMALGLAAGWLVPGLGAALDAVQVAGISLPIAIGLLAMMYPVLAKVRYDRLDTVTRDRRLLVPSLLLNWVLGPALMFSLAWVFLPDLPAYRTGLIIVGLARCIAMVIIWNDLAGSDREAAAVLVALNSVFQVLAFAGLGWFYLFCPPRLARPGHRRAGRVDRLLCRRQGRRVELRAHDHPGVVCLRAQRRALPDGRCPARPSRGRPGPRPLRGSIPAAEINPAVRAAMAELGLDLSAEYPKPLTDDVVQAADVVITMGCGDACPVYPGKRYLDWDLPDPAGKNIEEIRPIRDEIDHRVRTLLKQLVAAT